VELIFLRESFSSPVFVVVGDDRVEIYPREFSGGTTVDVRVEVVRVRPEDRGIRDL